MGNLEVVLRHPTLTITCIAKPHPKKALDKALESPEQMLYLNSYLLGMDTGEEFASRALLGYDGRQLLPRCLMPRKHSPDPQHDSPIDRKSFLKHGLFLLMKPFASAIEENMQKMTRDVIRPPGALPELEFLTECTKCDLCVEACHQGSIRLADETYGIAIGTPIIVPRETPCYMCDNMTCISACPTTALQPVDRHDVRMGTAVINTKTCLAYQGQICDYCHARCPFPDVAIFMEDGKRPVIVADKCTGCGLCEYYCVTTTPSIRIVPPKG